MACYLGLYGILSGLTKSIDHPSKRDSLRQGYQGRRKVLACLSYSDPPRSLQSMVLLIVLGHAELGLFSTFNYPNHLVCRLPTNIWLHNQNLQW